MYTYIFVLVCVFIYLYLYMYFYVYMYCICMYNIHLSQLLHFYRFLHLSPTPLIELLSASSFAPTSETDVKIAPST